MATKNTSTVPDKTADPTPQQVVNEGILKVVAATGIDVQKNRYKAMRAIAWQSFINAIEAGTFDALVSAAIANVEQLPSGWEIVAQAKPEPVATAQVKSPVKKATTTKAAARSHGEEAAR